MLSFLFIVIITAISIFISCVTSDNVTWFDYYTGGVIGFLLSGIILQIYNKRKKEQEIKNKKSIYEE